MYLACRLMIAVGFFVTLSGCTNVEPTVGYLSKLFGTVEPKVTFSDNLETTDGESIPMTGYCNTKIESMEIKNFSSSSWVPVDSVKTAGVSYCDNSSFSLMLDGPSLGLVFQPNTAGDVVKNIEVQWLFKNVYNEMQTQSKVLSVVLRAPLVTVTANPQRVNAATVSIVVSGSCSVEGNDVVVSGASGGPVTTQCVSATWSVTLAAVQFQADGTYSIIARHMKGPVGAPKAYSETNTSLVVDKTPPLISIASPLTNTSYKSGDASAILQGSCETGATLKVVVDAVTRQTFNCINSQFAVDILAYLNQFNFSNVSVEAQDLAGNINTTPGISVGKDTEPIPVITKIEASVSNQAYRVGSPIEIRVVFSQLIDLLPTAQPTLNLNTGVTLSNPTVVGNKLIFQYIVSNSENVLQLNIASAAALTTPVAGEVFHQLNPAVHANLGTAPVSGALSLIQHNIRIDNIAPVQTPAMSVIASTDNGVGPTVSWSAAIESGAIVQARVLDSVFSLELASWNTLTSGQSSHLSFIGNAPMETNTLYGIEFRLLDSAGNIGSTFGSVTFASYTCLPNYVYINDRLSGVSYPFCVFKYEARNVAGIPETRDTGLPWMGLSQSTASVGCTTNTTGGKSHRLPTTAEWNTIADSITQRAENWSNAIVGSGSVNVGYTGVSNTTPSFLPSTPAYACDSGFCGGAWDSTRRTHQIATNQEIWDISGNVAEWTIENLPMTGYTSAEADLPIMDPSLNLAVFGLLGPKAQVCASPVTNAYCGYGSVRMAVNDPRVARGATYSGMAGSATEIGIYSAHPFPDIAGTDVGFRCVYTP